ncbi:malonyl-CoA decarboxylase [Wolbachia endosymbiont of Armadillidium vulgare str. wVulC]|uniref:malonyl-CoA decarboxylase n=1 Tax=Wolbachia endosymbiont of Armadillidium vulgare TaxID=77039 RepID=UPI000649CC89|nr:malonyl-CoA decarboxylase [Wolbachia endosymbiont of Armadillidium vulgare]KLT22462.1 malonyl-CoA decarboxylase [Wolbachia endosymbiont of Armadillidium vulgare str. wVulC]OJH30397.1 Malonyl-CoA decarboxylase (MCD) [Armadillidium vulgare] [Wolbachia endosymbiont of Armadillidium vulgare]OJH31759.1 Malonyl-CoA decarboxylase (MCD) [Wolbachia endosymbiont of Armadillidium vulgare]OJH31778.1 Malonyl-CoA decarboxylase (MCD) [Wolbachia endosymbiont of Armadillidium vulgare]OJH32704.1 Malonyl-CoA 
MAKESLAKTDIVKVEDKKTVKGFFKILGEVADAVRSWVGNISPDLSSSRDIDSLVLKMNECLNPKGGEVSARKNTVSLGNLYLSLSEKGKIKFLQTLAEKFSLHKEEIDEKIKEYKENQNPELNYKFEQDLIKILESSRSKILKQFISLPEGLKFIVDMRSDVLKLKNQYRSLDPLENELKNILYTWVDVDLLDLRQITWDSPASLLEKLIKYEAVHEISSWGDLKNRLDSDHLCFAFFHYKIPNEPLIFVEVALVNKIADSIQHLLDESVPSSDPSSASTAIFYSISNTQAGLSGISLGNFLIKRVVEKLSQEFKSIRAYATLSPIPGFTKWLKHQDVALLGKLNIKQSGEEILESIKTNVECEKQCLLKLCAHYLLKVKSSSGGAYDPVAHFHLSNGASIKQLNWMADTSEKGISQSVGMMVNYLYELPKINNNHENYMINKAISCSKQVSSLLKG